jgi:hypothetical protein
MLHNTLKVTVSYTLYINWFVWTYFLCLSLSPSLILEAEI